MQTVGVGDSIRLTFDHPQTSASPIKNSKTHMTTATKTTNPLFPPPLRPPALSTAFTAKSKFLAILLLSCCAAFAEPSQDPRIDADFPGGNIILEKIEANTVTLRQDLRDTDGSWFYWSFRVRGAAGKTLSFRFTNGNVIGPNGPAASLDDGLTWTWLGKTEDRKSFSHTFAEDTTSVIFSLAMNYTEATLERFLKPYQNYPALERGVLCKSPEGRAVEQLRVGKIDGPPKHRVLVTARSHACEMMASYAVEGIIEAVLADDPLGSALRDHVEFLVIPFVDKDGVEKGDQGKNRKPRDHNRDYDERSIYPETRAIMETVPKWADGKLSLALDLHCPYISGGINEVIYLVGSSDPEIWKEQTRFGQILEKVRQGPLEYRASDNLPFGKAWNTGANDSLGTSGSRWAADLPGMKMASTVEIPYSNARGKQVTAESARAFGHDLARAIHRYLDLPAE